jgi:hypothetical protein
MGLIVGAMPPAWAGDAWTRYKDPKSGFTIDYPPGWGVLPLGEDPITFTGPMSAGGTLPLGVRVSREIQEPDSRAPLEQFAKALKADLSATLGSSFRPIGASAVKLGQADGSMFDYNEVGHLDTYYAIRLVTYGRRYAYVLSAGTMAKSPQFEAERALLRKVLLTFRPDTDVVAGSTGSRDKEVVAGSEEKEVVAGSKEEVAAGSKDTEVLAVLAELDAFTKELVAHVRSSPSPARGVTQAQGLLDARRAQLRPKMRAVRNVPDSQVSAETKKKIVDHISRDLIAVMTLERGYEIRTASDPAFRAGLDKLKSDYQELIAR